jgi:hypothetical protein
MGRISYRYQFDDIVEAVGNAAAEVLHNEGVTFSTTGRDVWVPRVVAAAHRMIEEHRDTSSDVANAEAAAQQVLRFAASRAREEGRDEITDADIAAAILGIKIWPFS